MEVKEKDVSGRLSCHLGKRSLTPASNPAESTFAHVLHVSPTFPK